MSLPRDARSFLDIIDTHKGILYKVANAYCRHADSRQDLIQEILVQLWLAFPRYDEQFRITTWLYRIALNVSISYYRKEHRRGGINHPLPEELLHLPEEAGRDLEAPVQALYRFIRALKEIDRAVMLLYLEGNTQQEIGDILGLTATNVSTKVGRIKQQLKKAFDNLQTDDHARY
ncbi:RNA polymerase sigma factor [Paraflavitalea pollutisoli]|uniref:RNA polymerase sigma factor n=1 Tax=Paraflavitalea pollutisoli TaxID=3034143 RepID=UPI0023EDF912|nr:RNA polymerase sigma factor [Paraflavitalea sp. H1-2-19X]